MELRGALADRLSELCVSVPLFLAKRGGSLMNRREILDLIVSLKPKFCRVGVMYRASLAIPASIPSANYSVFLLYREHATSPVF